MFTENQLEVLTEQTKDAINILQLLEVELAANEDDEHIIRTVSIIQKMLQEHLSTLQQPINYYCENIQRSSSTP